MPNYKVTLTLCGLCRQPAQFVNGVSQTPAVLEGLPPNTTFTPHTPDCEALLVVSRNQEG